MSETWSERLVHETSEREDYEPRYTCKGCDREFAVEASHETGRWFTEPAYCDWCGVEVEFPKD